MTDKYAIIRIGELAQIDLAAVCVEPVFLDFEIATASGDGEIVGNIKADFAKYGLICDVRIVVASPPVVGHVTEAT